MYFSNISCARFCVLFSPSFILLNSSHADQNSQFSSLCSFRRKLRNSWQPTEDEFVRRSGRRTLTFGLEQQVEVVLPVVDLLPRGAVLLGQVERRRRGGVLLVPQHTEEFRKGATENGQLEEELLLVVPLYFVYFTRKPPTYVSSSPKCKGLALSRIT